MRGGPGGQAAPSVYVCFGSATRSLFLGLSGLFSALDRRIGRLLVSLGLLLRGLGGLVGPLLLGMRGLVREFLGLAAFVCGYRAEPQSQRKRRRQQCCADPAAIPPLIHLETLYVWDSSRS
jgi:hypothetical protein